MQQTPHDIPETLRQALERAKSVPADSAAWEAVDEAAREHDRPDEVSELYRETVRLDLEPKLLLQLGERAVAFHEEWYEDSSYAVQILKRLSTVPGGDWAFERLSLLLTMAERWDELLAEYDRKLAHTVETVRRLPLLEEAARIAKDFSGQGERASDYLKELLLSKPEDDQLAEMLERRLERQQRHQDLIDIWGARLGTLPEPVALATRVQIANRQLNELDDAFAALQVAEEILELEGGPEEACRLLEEIAAREDSGREARRRALEILRERYALTDRKDDVVRILELSLTVAENDAERRELHESSARSLVERDRHEQALPHAAALLCLSPQSAEAHAQLWTLAERTRRFDSYVAALIDAARNCRADERRIQMLVDAGKVCEEQLADQARATQLYRDVLSDPRAGEEPRLHSARRLRHLLGEVGRDAELLPVLERLAELEPSARGQRHVLGEAAELADRQGDIDRSLALWQRCFEVSEGDVAALDARIEILERAERWEALIADLRRRAQLSEAPAARRSDLVRVARTYETRLFRIEAAIDVWSEVEQQFGSSAESVDALVDLCAAAGRMEDVITLLGKAAESEQDPHRRTEQLARLGDVYREHEQDPGRAIDYYRQALTQNPMSEPARAGLRALLIPGPNARAAVETLAAALTRADEWPGVLELVEFRVRASSEPTACHSILMEAADILEQRAQDPGGALTYMCRAFELDPNEELEGELKRLARTSGEWGVLASGYQRAIEHSESGDRVRSLRYQRGQILEDRIEDLEAALDCYRQIVENEPTHRDAACAVARVAAKLRAWTELGWVFVQSSIALGQVDRKVADAVEQASAAENAWEHTTQALFERIEATRDLAPKVAHDLRRELAVWYRDKRSDLATAETLLSLAVESQAEEATLRMLADLRRREPGRPLVSTLLLLADAAPHDLAILHEAATAALETVQDEELARPILERARQAAGDALCRGAGEAGASELEVADRVAWWSIEKLVELARGRRAFSEALDLLVAGAELPFGRERCLQLSYQAAVLARSELDDSELSARICRGILEKAPDHSETIAALGDIYEESERYRDLLDLRRKELDQTPPLERRLVLRLDEARILATLGEGPEAQINALRRNIDESPGHAASIDALESIWRASGEHLALFRMFSEQAARVAPSDAVWAAALWARAGQLADSTLENVEQALAAYEQSVALNPTPPVLDALARLSAAQGQHLAAVTWLERRLALTPDGDLEPRRATVVELATALFKSGDEARARAYLSEGLARDPAGAELRSLLARLYRAAGDWELLAPLLTEGVDHTHDTLLQVEYLWDAASVRREQLGQLEESIPLLERAVALEPTERKLRLSLAEALRDARRYDEARGLLLGVLEEFGRRRTPERAQVHFQLAQIARATGNLDVALEQLDLASKVDRDNIHMLKLLGEVAREKGQLEEAERAYRTLLLLLGRTSKHDAPSRTDIGESAILFELYRIATELGQSERAKDLLDSALEAGAQGEEEAKRLEQALRDAGQHELLLRALERRMSHTTQPAALAAILRARADVLLGLGRTEAALAARLEALSHAPANTPLVHEAWALGERLDQTARVCAEISTLAEKAAALDADLACGLWFELGALCEARGDRQRAAELYAHAQNTGRRPLECLEAMERVGAFRDPVALASALRLFVDNADPDVAPTRYTEALYRLGMLELEQGQPEEAVQHIEVALTRDGNNRRVLDMFTASVAQRPPTPEVVELFERVARDAGDEAALLSSLTFAAQLGSASLPSLHEAVELARAAGDEASTLTLLEAAVTLARETQLVDEAIWAVTALAEHYEQSGRASAAAELLQDSIAHVSEREALELRLRLAALAAGRLGDLRLAASVYERLLEEEPTSPRVWRPLFDVYRKQGDLEKLEASISAVERAVDDPEQRRSLRIERMRILIAGDRKADAEAALRALLDEEPEFDEGSNLLEELLESQGRLAELHGVIERRLDAARQRGDRQGIVTGTLRLGKILAETDHEAAVDVYRRSLDQVRDERELLEAFLSLCNDERHASDRARALYELIALDSSDRAEARTLELVSLYRARDDGAGVERALERGLRQNPASEALHAERLQWYRQTNDWDKLARALCDHAMQLGDARLKREQIEQAALIYETQLGDAQRAAETLELAVEPAALDPDLLAKLAQHWLAANEPHRALSHLTRAIELHSREDAALGALFHLRGTLRLRTDGERLETIDAAIGDFSRAAELAPGRAREDLAGTLRTKLEALDRDGGGARDAERGPTLLRLARVLGDLGDMGAAVELINDYVSEHPGDKAAQLELGHLATRRGDWAVAVTAYRGLFPLCSGEELLGVVLKLAEACENLGTPLDAKDALELAHAQFPGEEAIRRRLRKMYQAAKAYKGWANMLTSEAEGTTDPSQRFELLSNAGDLYRQAEDGALPEARDAYSRALAIEDDAKTMVKLIDVEVQLGQIEEAATRLDEAIRRHGKRRSPELSILQHAMARVATAAGDDEAVFAWLEAALYSDRQNGAVASELAALAMSRGEYDVAIKALQLVTLLKSPGPMSRAEAYLRQAAIAKHRGDIKKSALLAKRALTTDPDYQEAKNFLDELQVTGDSLIPEA